MTGELRIIASDLKFPEGPVVLPDGSLVVVEIAGVTIKRIDAKGRCAIVARPGGGPNGAALGPEGKLYVCNNGGFKWLGEGNQMRPNGMPEENSGGWIERIDLETGKVERLYDRCGPNRLSSPNDLVFDRHGGFYFTDTGHRRARERDHGGIYYAMADGSRIVEVLYPVVMPNGIGLSPDQSRVYWAETGGGRLWAIELEQPGVARKAGFPSPNGSHFVANGVGLHLFDSLAVEANGNICVATLTSGCIHVFSPDGKTVRIVPTNDPLTTNLCFGGPDMRTAYITLTRAGQLAAMDWPEAGLALNY